MDVGEWRMTEKEEGNCDSGKDDETAEAGNSSSDKDSSVSGCDVWWPSSGKKSKFGHFLVAVQPIHRLTQADISCTTTARLFFFPLLCGEVTEKATSLSKRLYKPRGIWLWVSRNKQIKINPTQPKQPRSTRRWDTLYKSTRPKFPENSLLLYKSIWFHSTN